MSLMPCKTAGDMPLQAILGVQSPWTEKSACGPLFVGLKNKNKYFFFFFFWLAKGSIAPRCRSGAT